jgi:hypothetical protein
MAPRRPTCDAGLHWKFCQLKDAGCPFHGTTAIFVSDSRWVDQISYNRRIKEWDEQHGSAGAASSSTANPSHTAVVRGGLSEVSKKLGDAEDSWKEMQNLPNHSEKSRTKANIRTSMKTVTHRSYAYDGNQSMSRAVKTVRWRDPLVEIRIFK